VSARAEHVAVGSTGVTLRLGDQGGWISGQVLADTSSKPVASFAVILSQAVGKLEERPVETRSFFDAQGNFLVGPFAPGSYVMRVAAHDFATSKARSILVAAGNTTQAEVRLSGGGALEGRVVDGASGRGIAGARVLLEGTAIGDGLPLAIETSAIAAADGMFRIAGISSGEHHCLGAALARYELACMLATLAKVLPPGSRLREDRLEVARRGLFQRLVNLPVKIDRRRASDAE
jgi:hypothetical protein